MHLKALWLNGQLVDHTSPHLKINDHGLVVGDGVFETLLAVTDPNSLSSDASSSSGVSLSELNDQAIKNNEATTAATEAVASFEGRRTAFAVRRHLHRLRRSASVLDIDCPYSNLELHEAIDACLAAAPDSSLVRITLTSGLGPLGSPRGDEKSTVMVMVGGDRFDYQPGTTVAVMPFPRNERGVLTNVKSLSYAENVIALKMAKERGASEAVFGDTRGYLSEGTGSNIFWVEDGVVYTPPLDTGCLAGITRGLVMELLDVTEKHLQLDALPLVSEAFLTSTTRIAQSISTVISGDNVVTLPTIDGVLTCEASAALTKLLASNIDP